MNFSETSGSLKREHGSGAAATSEATGTPVDALGVPLQGKGVASADYLSDGQWHHIAFVKDGASGDQAIW